VRAKQTVFRLTLSSDPKQIGRVEGFLKKVRHSVVLDEIQFHKLMVSLTEAVNNAIIHGNRQDPVKKVAVRCEVLPGWLVVMVTDQGKGFRPKTVKNPLDKKNLLRTSGRGVFLMRTLMDKVEFDVHSTGSKVLLWLDLSKG
jgi:serine/threonine-protein kinase RsbW